jgi:hypothetical protein
MNDADRDVWNEMQRDAAPDVTRLSDRIHTARKEHTLDCGCIVKPGEKYGVVVDLVDGKMETYKGHALGWATCPTLYAPSPPEPLND